ncbi:MAG: alkaline phosphatase family protein [Ignavibacteria bacterium]|nr:alkaline phosphatase family protein [Ignavibacteria bacterium]
MKKYLFTILFVASSCGIAAQPKLVVIIVLDQFPYEYMTRFQPYFSKGGFNYLLEDGANFENAKYEHAYTKTAPGHAAIVTGVYSHLNGITSNRWYDRDKKRAVNCVDDETVRVLGNHHMGRSPRNLQTPTVGDLLREKTNFQSKVIGISNKDRSAILMAGKRGTAYWIEDSVIVSSSYYMEKLPEYVTTFNTSGVFQKYFGKQWTEINASVAAKVCDDDDVPYEGDIAGLGRAFPHSMVGSNTSHITPSYYTAVEHSPFATEILLTFAQKVVIGETLGTRNVTDMLCIGISATDEIGHLYGPQSHEVFDVVLRTDSLMGDLFAFLEEKVGLKNCLIALTSDHGIPSIPEYLKKKNPKGDAGRFRLSDVIGRCTAVLDKVFEQTSGSRWVEQVIDSDIYLNRDLLKEKNIPLGPAMRVLKDSLPVSTPFAAAYTRDELDHSLLLDHWGQMVAKSYYPSRSGDVMFVLKPYYINTGDNTGTSHGQPYDYDTHVPLIVAGKDIKQGTYQNEASPVDIAATIGALLGVKLSPDCEGRILREAMK